MTRSYAVQWPAATRVSDLTCVRFPRVEGLAVDLAARIVGLAGPEQVLMSAARLRIAVS